MIISGSPTDGAEAERQLAAAAERHREVAASLEQSGRPAAAQHVAVKSVARGVHLVSFALKRAAQAGVPFERLVELTGWEPELVRAALAHAEPEPWFMARLAPTGLDGRAVAQAAAGIEATARLHALMQRILDDVDDEAWTPAPADLDDLHDGLETVWRSWRRPLRRPQP